MTGSVAEMVSGLSAQYGLEPGDVVLASADGLSPLTIAIGAPA